MTWGMFAIGWLELNDMDKAMEAFERQFLNVVPPFNVYLIIFFFTLKTFKHTMQNP